MPINQIYSPFAKRPLIQDNQDGGSFSVTVLLRNNFTTFTWILVGASLQALAVYLFSNGRYVLLISTLLLGFRLGKTLLQTFNIMPNPYLKDAFSGRTTALLPSDESGEPTTEANKKIAIMHLGAKSNHPLGYLAPQFGKLGDWFTKMCTEFDAGSVKGFMGQTTFHRTDALGAPEVVSLSYWDSIEALWEFAHGDLHREAWQWWERDIKENGYVGINHEIFEADAKHWETIYVNFQPTMMGATTHLKRGGKTLEGGVVPDQYISPLVDARKGPLAKSSGRMGRPISTYDATRVAKETYE